MPGRTVAVFTVEGDVTADHVIVELNRRAVPVFRCDPGDFPPRLMMGARFGPRWTGHLQSIDRRLDLNDIRCSWWRRPGRITAPADVREPTWVAGEANAAFRGLMATLPWLNSPDDIRRAEHKPLQLVVAARVGLNVPPTLITNDSDQARAFAKEHGRLVYKSMTSGHLSDGRAIYATPVEADDVDDSVRVTAHLFQQEVPKDHELRVTVVDGRMFAARIDASTVRGRRDWRADYTNLTYTPVQIPDCLADKLREFMMRLRLRFAAFDIIVTPHGEHVFLESNPNGQWAWIEEATGIPIAAAIADALEGRIA
jgi:ATP-grasp ribosomal peptide maturase